MSTVDSLAHGLNSKFPLGQLVATTSLARAYPLAELLPYLQRHASCDWGNVGEEDRKANDEALLLGSRLLSAYTLTDNTRIWIITEHDRSVTTILRPEEY